MATGDDCCCFIHVVIVYAIPITMCMFLVTQFKTNKYKVGKEEKNQHMERIECPRDSRVAHAVSIFQHQKDCSAHNSNCVYFACEKTCIFRAALQMTLTTL